jgi:hypothetical protein
MSENLAPATPGSAAEDEVRAVLERARRGDAASLPALRAALDEHPEIWEQYGDLAAHALQSWLGLICGDDLSLKESLDRKLSEMTAELAGPAPSPLETLLVGRVVATWLQLHHADIVAARAVDVSIRQADFAIGRQDSANRRHLQAIGALATVRRLLGSAAGPSVRASKATRPGAGGGDAGDAPMGPGPGTGEAGPPDGEPAVEGHLLGFEARPDRTVAGNGRGRPRGSMEHRRIQVE